MTTRPDGLGPAGARLWDSLNRTLEFDPHEELLLGEACRVADRLDDLNTMIKAGLVVLRDGTPNPALIEARQQQIALARLIASLRLPDDLAAPERRPQRRGAARGSYLRGVS